MKKIWILTICDEEEGNITPEAFNTKEKAMEALKKNYEADLAFWMDDDPDYIVDHNIYSDYAYITYPNNAVRYEIYEVEVK